MDMITSGQFLLHSILNDLLRSMTAVRISARSTRSCQMKVPHINTLNMLFVMMDCSFTVTDIDFVCVYLQQ